LEEFEGPRYQRIGHIKKRLSEGAVDETLRATETVPARELVVANG
jgi:hypothetical protein